MVKYLAGIDPWIGKTANYMDLITAMTKHTLLFTGSLYCCGFSSYVFTKFTHFE